jgi:hypothetical protein
VFWFGVLFDVELVVASDSSSEQDSSNDGSSPAEFVTVNGGQENPESADGSASTIFVMETTTVTELVIVSVGSQSCLRRTANKYKQLADLVANPYAFEL